jgi:hypothetical protein
MRSADLERLSGRYVDDGRSPDDWFAEALGVQIDSARGLVSRLVADFDSSTLGIRWMAPGPGTRRRILISDHILQCAASIETNLIEAELHRLELTDAVERDSDRYVGAVETGDGEVRVNMPRRVSALDDLPTRLRELHAAGLFRAIGSALDCLGAVIVGLLALPGSLLRADLGDARRALENTPDPPQERGDMLRREFAMDLSGAISAAGPPGWLAWAVEYRNMLVHRGRRFEMAQFMPLGGQLHGTHGETFIPVRVVHQLARDPARSDMEAFVALSIAHVLAPRSVKPVLEEPDAVTLKALVESVSFVLARACELLVDVVEARRADPTIFDQPTSQWENVPSGRLDGFEGYEPGAAEFSVDQLIANPVFRTRLAAASLLSDAALSWTGFD